MLKRSKKDENSPLADSAKPVTPKSNSALTPPVSKDETTTIGEHIAIEGSVRGNENLVIEGSMKGNVELEKRNFTVGSKGRVDGEINARNVSISGQLNGIIKAGGKVEITKEADFFGDIKAKSISVEDGAYFKGSIELSREPHRKGSSASTSKASSSSNADKAAFSPSSGTNKES